MPELAKVICATIGHELTWEHHRLSEPDVFGMAEYEAWGICSRCHLVMDDSQGTGQLVASTCALHSVADCMLCHEYPEAEQ